MPGNATTADLKAALLKAYALPEYATFLEVGDGTGANVRRHADAVTMSVWPSRGLTLTGFEIKASRGDWLREKKDPEKSATVQRYCDAWVLFTAPDVVLPGELPATWGHIELHRRKLVRVVEPPRLTPVPLARTFIAALLRRASQCSRDVLQAAAQAAVAEEREAIEARVEREVARRTADTKQIYEALAAFKEASGVDILATRGAWSAQCLGEDFAAFRRLRRDTSFDRLADIEASLRKVEDQLHAVHVAMEQGGISPPSKEACEGAQA